MQDDKREAREEVLKDAWRWERVAKKAGLWEDLIPIKCPECGTEGEWPKASKRPTCRRCYLWKDESIQMQRVREPPPPPPPPRRTHTR